MFNPSITSWFKHTLAYFKAKNIPLLLNGAWCCWGATRGKLWGLGSRWGQHCMVWPLGVRDPTNVEWDSMALYRQASQQDNNNKQQDGHVYTLDFGSFLFSLGASHYLHLRRQLWHPHTLHLTADHCQHAPSCVLLYLQQPNNSRLQHLKKNKQNTKNRNRNLWGLMPLCSTGEVSPGQQRKEYEVVEYFNITLHIPWSAHWRSAGGRGKII